MWKGELECSQCGYMFETWGENEHALCPSCEDIEAREREMLKQYEEGMDA
jgi:rubrerythrin